ncbi:CHAT domain-containing protein [Pseudanabaena sp. FACHB-1998]|uniref:CHAT domain-containing protein n=1 Tax=Pseudanabaena sp. FACHB-1998 TaxID=2692858 RepID=UPI001F551DFF|nr:CHAT domain-containing protein [Pseudanabaena sp. FACHB-1998]
MKLNSKQRKFWKYFCLATLATILTLFFGWNIQPSIANNLAKLSMDEIHKLKPHSVIAQSLPNNYLTLIQTGKQYYQSAQYAKAIALWQQALDILAKQGDRLNQAVVLQNLALAQQQLGNWREAEKSILFSLEILQSNPEQPKLLAQALNVQGNIQLVEGKPQEALATWQRAAIAYEQLGDKEGFIRSKINQSLAMRSLGLYPKARDTLKQLQSVIRELPNSSLKVSSLLNLGDTLRLSGDFSEATLLLQESLVIAKQLDDAADMSEIFLSLGNIAYSQQQAASSGDSDYRQQKSFEAIAYYQQAAKIATNPLPKVKSQLNQLRLEIELKQIESAKKLLLAIQPQLQTLPLSRSVVYARVNFAQSLIKLSPDLSDRQLAAQLLANAAQQAKEMGDPRAESYAIGYLGELYEQFQQFSEAQGLTEQALILAQTNNASDIAYRWQWQLGRILKAQGKKSQAIAAYNEAVNTLASIRGDLVSSNTDIQFSFRDSVEPVYRQLTALLLTPEKGKPVSLDNLKAARKVIESLQLAELDNFFKEACLVSKATQVEDIDSQAAVIYPIVLPDSLEVIISLPDRSLQHHSTQIPQDKLEQLFSELRRSLRRTSLETDIQAVSAKLYNILIGKEIESALAANKIKTLAFVLDGSLRNLPMAVLYDGNQYLMEKYNLAIAPGLQLIDPRPLKRQQLEVFIGGLSKETQNFKSLPNVEREIKQISAMVSSQAPLINETFLSSSIQKQINKIPFRVVHLATHGEFSSDAEKTFILTWDNRLGVKELGELLQTKAQDSRNPIELLVLSACKTAKGDKRATLGLAGVAVRSGARSTIASLWSVEDGATATLMENFYQELSIAGTTKADALRRAQMSLLKNTQFTHPFYWAPFVLVGNWL